METEQKWIAIFEELDSDKGGTLSVDELHLGLQERNIHVSKFAIESFTEDFDENNDGKITKDEFVKLMSKTCIHKPGAMEEAFKKFDTDGSGFISKAELKSMMQSLGMDISRKNVQEMMRSVSRDDKIDYKDFVKAMK